MWIEENWKIQVQPGLVSLVYSILFGLILLTTLDTTLASLMSYVYYKRISKAIPLTLKSSDIPGVTSFLLGNNFSFVNIIAVILKVAACIGIIIVEGMLDSEITINQSTVNRTALSVFNGSDTFWFNSNRFKWSILWMQHQRCRIVHPINQTILYYSVAFNFQNENAFNQSQQNHLPFDNRTTQYVNYSTTICLSPDHVNSQNVTEITRVIGCANLTKNVFCDQLDSSSIIEVRITNGEKGFALLSNFSGPGLHLNYNYGYSDNVPAMSTYTNNLGFSVNRSRLVCIQRPFGVLNTSNVHSKCIFSAHVHHVKFGDLTLLEHWIRHEDTLQGDFPKNYYATFSKPYFGPLFKSHISFGQYQEILLLHQLWSTRQGVNWKTLSSYFVGNMAIPLSQLNNIIIFHPHETKSIIPFVAVIVAIILIIFVIILTMIVFCVLRHGDVPRLNSVTGLSFLTRQQNTPSNFVIVPKKRFVMLMIAPDHNPPVDDMF